MAKQSTRFGNCENFDGCNKAKKGEIIELDELDDFICPECKFDLHEVKKVKKTNWMLIGGVAAVVCLGGGGAAYMLMKPAEVRVSALTLSGSTNELLIGGMDSLTVTNMPAESKATYTWSSGDQSVATVTNGVVTPVGAGKVSITVKAQENELASAVWEYTITDTVTIIEEPLVAEEPEVANEQPKSGGAVGQTSGTVDLTYAVYEGPLKNGKPHGVGGKLTFKSAYTIDLKKVPAETVEAHAGDSMVSVKFDNGRLVQGELRFVDGRRRWIQIG